MWQACKTFGFCPLTAALSVNYLDRYLAQNLYSADVSKHMATDTPRLWSPNAVGHWLMPFGFICDYWPNGCLSIYMTVMEAMDVRAAVCGLSLHCCEDGRSRCAFTTRFTGNLSAFDWSRSLQIRLISKVSRAAWPWPNYACHFILFLHRLVDWNTISTIIQFKGWN